MYIVCVCVFLKREIHSNSTENFARKVKCRNATHTHNSLLTNFLRSTASAKVHRSHPTQNEEFLHIIWNRLLPYLGTNDIDRLAMFSYIPLKRRSALQRGFFTFGTWAKITATVSCYVRLIYSRRASQRQRSYSISS